MDGVKFEVNLSLIRNATPNSATLSETVTALKQNTRKLEEEYKLYAFRS